jgi:hypothetical protein
LRAQVPAGESTEGQHPKQRRVAHELGHAVERRRGGGWGTLTTRRAHAIRRRAAAAAAAARRYLSSNELTGTIPSAIASFTGLGNLCVRRPRARAGWGRAHTHPNEIYSYQNYVPRSQSPRLEQAHWGNSERALQRAVFLVSVCVSHASIIAVVRMCVTPRRAAMRRGTASLGPLTSARTTRPLGFTAPLRTSTIRILPVGVGLFACMCVCVCVILWDARAGVLAVALLTSAASALRTTYLLDVDWRFELDNAPAGPCTFPINMTGQECMGLSEQDASTPEAWYACARLLDSCVGFKRLILMHARCCRCRVASAPPHAARAAGARSGSGAPRARAPLPGDAGRAHWAPAPLPRGGSPQRGSCPRHRRRGTAATGVATRPRTTPAGAS